MKTVVFFIILFFGINVFAGNNDPLFDPNAPLKSQSSSFNPDFGLSIGSSFMSFQGAGSLFSQSIAPTLSWKASDKFSFHAGALLTNFNPGSGFYSNTSMMNTGSGMFETDFAGSNVISSMFFVAGSYHVNSNLTISGAGYYDQNKSSALFMNQNMNSMFGSGDIKGMMLGLDYKFSENFRFGAEINFSSGYNPMSPFNQGVFNHGGFGMSSFRNNSIW